MASLEIESSGKGRIRLHGVLGFDTVTGALERSEELFEDHPRIEIDLGGVESTDSAGLALLVEWAAWAKRQDRKLVLRNLPTQALALARISEVDKILPLER